MNSKLVAEDDKQKYEKEFLDFLIQKIKHAGGSLQFQHLPGIVLQLKFEIRETFGTTKKDIMKFLRSHPQVFKLDSKGSVTLAAPSAFEDCNSIDIADKNSSKKSTKTKQPQIKNGRGIVLKLSDTFGFIKADYPFETTVFFTSQEYGDKVSLLTEPDLHQKSEVFFNAIYGHGDFEVEYRATKVWQCDSRRNNKNSNSESYKKKEDIDILQAEDNIILNEKEKETVRAFAVCNKKLEMQSKVVLAMKSSKQFYCQPSSHSVNGKIFPYTNGAVIKFGKDFSKIANGDSCEYFLYGSRVSMSDIDWEFSQGDDIFFDVIKTETGWKAVRAWVGEEPISTCQTRTPIEKRNKMHEDQNSQSISDVSSESSYSSARGETSSKFRPRNRKVSGKGENNLYDNFDDVKDKSYKQKHFEKSKSTVQKSELKKCNRKFKKENSRVNKSSEICQSSDADCNAPMQIVSSEENKLDINYLENYRNSSDDDLDFKKHSSISFTKGNKYTSRFKLFKDSLDNIVNIDSKRKSWAEAHSIEGLVNNSKNKACIMEHKEIDGKIIRVYCKMAIMISACLQKEIEFVYSTFYFNGKHIDEYNIGDLKEVLNINDIIKFNCIEIIDDKGDLYQKVTSAWKGPKPTLLQPESTPEDFIAELELSVSVMCELDNQCIQEPTGQNSIFTNLNCASANNPLDFNSQIKAASASETIKDISQNDELQYPLQTIKRNEETDELNLHCKLLSERIIQTFKNNGFVSDPKVDLRIANDVINLILESSCIKETLNQEQSLKSFCPGDSSQLLCSNCAKSCKLTTNVKVDAEVQTIITGKVVATSIYAHN